MSPPEIAFLSLVLAGFAIFVSTLAWASRYGYRRDTNRTAPSAPHGAAPTRA